MISPLRLLHTLAWLPALVLPSRPQDTPCVTWKQSQCNFVSDIADYVPAILSACMALVPRRGRSLHALQWPGRLVRLCVPFPVLWRRP